MVLAWNRSPGPATETRSSFNPLLISANVRPSYRSRMMRCSVAASIEPGEQSRLPCLRASARPSLYVCRSSGIPAARQPPGYWRPTRGVRRVLSRVGPIIRAEGLVSCQPRHDRRR